MLQENCIYENKQQPGYDPWLEVTMSYIHTDFSQPMPLVSIPTAPTMFFYKMCRKLPHHADGGPGFHMILASLFLLPWKIKTLQLLRNWLQPWLLLRALGLGKVPPTV